MDSFLRAQVWGMFLQSVAFGVYLVTCGSCYRALFTSRHRGLYEINWRMLLIFLLFLAKTTSSVGIHLFLGVETVIMSDRGAAADKFLDASRPVNISKYVTVLVQAVMASAFFIYRCWLVHHQSWLVIAFPFVLWLGAVALMGIVIHVDTAFNITGLFAISQSKVFGSCFWAAIIAINIITTGQITWRIFRVDHRRSCSNAQLQSRDSMAPTLKAPTGNSMKLATHIAIESGMIYTIMTLVVFFLFVANSVAVYTAINILVPMIGIAFNLVIIHNRPRPQTSCLTELNSVPLQFTSSNLSVPASAIEFAYPKNFMPRRKKPTTEPAKEDSELSSDMPGIPQNLSQQSIQ